MRTMTSVTLVMSAWLKINHPEAELSVASSVGTSSSSGQHHLGSVNSAKNTDSSDILSEVLVLPEPKEKPARGNRLLLRKLCALLKMTC